MTHPLRAGLIALAATLLALPAGAQPLDQLGEFPGRACRDDLFFVDVPVATRVPRRFGRAMGVMRRSLQGIANGVAMDWFGRAVRVRVRRERLLPVRRAPAYVAPGRGGAAWRFWRLRFEDRATGERLAVLPEAQCDVVATLRSELAAALKAIDGDPTLADTLNIGRACDAGGMGAEGAPSPQMLRWHTDRIGAPPSLPGPPTGAGPAVHVALVDTGVALPFADLLGATCEDDNDPTSLAGKCAPDFDLSHWHASAMALLVRQVAAEASLHFFPALGAGDVAPVGEVARALDRALHAPEIRGEPLVINLSLGWPPEAGQPAVLEGAVLASGVHPDVTQGGRCLTREDPVGEAVRWMLDVAARRDYREAPTVVNAAAGNRRSAPYQSFTRFEMAPDASRDPCGFNPALGQGQPLFFPAEWSRRLTCRRRRDGTTTRPRQLVNALGATDAREQHAALFVPFTDTPLLAPGDHVYVQGHPEWAGLVPATPSAPICGGAGAGNAGLTLPKVISGTSGPAALASGVAAEALRIHAQVNERRAAAGRAPLQPLRRRRMARMLYLTGEPLCGTTPSGLPERRLSLSRFEAALRHRRARRLLACANRPAPFGLITPGTLAACARHLAWVGLADGACLDAGLEIEWPVEPIACVECCIPGGATPCPAGSVDCRDPRAPAPVAADCVASPCAFEAHGPDRYSLGSAGPQPQNPWCPECGVRVLGPSTSSDLFINLYEGIPSRAGVEYPYLVLTRPDGGRSYVSLRGYVARALWTPGSTFVLRNVKLPASVAGWTAVEWKTARPTLLMYANTGGRWARDESPLRRWGP